MALWLCGRGFGKTRSGAEWFRKQAAIPGLEHLPMAIIGRTAKDVRDVLIEGPAGILQNSPPWDRPHYEPSKSRLTWRNGAWASTYSAEEPDALRGPQFRSALCDEIAAWPYFDDAWSNLLLGVRLGDSPRIAALTTPRPSPVLRDMLEDKTVKVIHGATADNAANLSRIAVKRLYDRYAGTRLGRQELEGELLLDLVGALWPQASIDEAHKNFRAWGTLDREAFERVVIGIDPSGSEGDGQDEGDEQGIVAAAKLKPRAADVMKRRFVVLEDDTAQRSPAGWAAAAHKMAVRWGADSCIAEKNFGGAMVRSTLMNAGVPTAVRLVNASRGKTQRAEPISALYEQGHVAHPAGADPEPPADLGALSEAEREAWDETIAARSEAGRGSHGLTELEKEYSQFTSSGYKGKRSPNRADAAIWALTNLAYGMTEPSIRSLHD